MDWHPDNRPHKMEARKYLFSNTPVAMTSLWMPAGQCFDIELALDLGLLDRCASRIVAVEQDEAIFVQMCESIKRFNFVNPPILIRSPLHRVTLPFTLDFAFLDFCGLFSRDLLLWMCNQLGPRITPGGGIALTCGYAVRNSDFLKGCREALLFGFSAVYEEFSRNHAYHIQADDAEFEPVEVPALLLKCTFGDYTFTFRRPYTYRDAMPMIGFRLRGFQPSESGDYPAIAEVLQAVPVAPEDDTRPPMPSIAPRRKTPIVEIVPERVAEPEEEPVSVEDWRSLAARKAHETRRKNNWIHPLTRKKLLALGWRPPEHTD